MTTIERRKCNATSSNGDLDLDFLIELCEAAKAFIVANMPMIKEATLEAIETVFAIKAVAKRLALVMALEAGIVTVNQVFYILSSFFSTFSSRTRLIRHLQQQQTCAADQDEWMELAERIDNIHGDDIWRSNPQCQLYEQDRIQARIDEYIQLMRRNDIFELMFVLRGGIGRNKFGLLHEGLFQKAMAGPKVLVETYHNVVCATLDYVCDAPTQPGQGPIPTETRLAFFNETRHSYGRSALLLSGGATLGFYHFGVVKTLMKNELMPKVLGGASAGSIVCAMVGTRTDEECLHDLFEMQGTQAPGHSGELAYNLLNPKYLSMKNKPPSNDDLASRPIFWPIRCLPTSIRLFSTFLYDLITFKTRPYEFIMSDTEHLRECLRTNVGNFTFQEAFDRTGRILNITVTPNNTSDPPRLLNFLTSPHVLVWSAAAASSSVPGVFEANRLMVKEVDGTIRYESSEGGQHFSDGSMEQDLPMQQLSEMFNVNHFIISQANPHAAIFASYYHVRSVWSSPTFRFFNGILSFLKDCVRSWAAHLVHLVGTHRIAPKHATSRSLWSHFFVQEYEGRDCDISLIPWSNHRSRFSAIMNVLYNPDWDEIEEWVEAAERETWKYIPAIKSHIAEEITLDHCVQRLRKRLAAESLAKHGTGVVSRQLVSQVSIRGIPSFCISPSNQKLDDQKTLDPPKIKRNDPGIPDRSKIIRNFQHEISAQYPILTASTEAQPFDSFNLGGYNDMGLYKNSSCGSLKRPSSACSGLFVEDETFVSSESTDTEVRDPSPTSTSRDPPTSINQKKSASLKGAPSPTCMADFYYRKSGSQNNLTLSSIEDKDIKEYQGICHKSKSHSDLPDSNFKYNPAWGFVQRL